MNLEKVYEIPFASEANQIIRLNELSIQLRWLAGHHEAAFYISVSKDDTVIAAGIRLQPNEISVVPGLGDVVLLAERDYMWQDLGTRANIYYEAV